MTFGMQGISHPGVAIAGVAPQGVYPSNAGVLTVWGSKGKFYWSVLMYRPASNFVGTVNTTDLTSGFSGGYVKVHAFSGYVTTSNRKGHVYSGVITGTAYLGSTPVAKTVPNYTVWQNK